MLEKIPTPLLQSKSTFTLKLLVGAFLFYPSFLYPDSLSNFLSEHSSHLTMFWTIRWIIMEWI